MYSHISLCMFHPCAFECVIALVPPFSPLLLSFLLFSPLLLSFLLFSYLFFSSILSSSFLFSCLVLSLHCTFSSHHTSLMPSINSSSATPQRNRSQQKQVRLVLTGLYLVNCFLYISFITDACWDTCTCKNIDVHVNEMELNVFLHYYQLCFIQNQIIVISALCACIKVKML